MGNDYYKGDYKRVVQEIAELVGYFLLMMGSFEAVSQLKIEILRRHQT